MTKDTPRFTQPQLPFDEPSVKLCECGCGEPLPTPKYPSQQRRFLKGHNTRGTMDPNPNPGGLCLCGCGQPAPIAKMTSRKFGWVIGKPKKYIHGHTLKDRDKRTLEERFWDHIDKRGPDECWLHRTEAGVASKRYGSITFGGTSLSAHRVSYELHFGPIPDGLFVLHRCDRPACCNPAHLFLGTPLDNMQDKVEKGRENGFFERGDARDRGRKLTEAQVREIRRRRERGERMSALAKEYGVGVVTISRIVNYKTWKHV